MTIARTILLDEIQTALARAPVTILTGPRQTGKTTLEPLRGLIVIDEVQRLRIPCGGGAFPRSYLAGKGVGVEIKTPTLAKLRSAPCPPPSPSSSPFSNKKHIAIENHSQ